MSKAKKARETVLMVEIPRDELALRIAQPCIGMTYTGDKSATELLDEMNKQFGVVPMGEGFRQAADAAIIYMHDCINKGVQPQ